MNNERSSCWHQGELSIQRRAGTDKRMAEIGPKFIRGFMPRQHRDFFESLSMIFIGYSDDHSLASVLFGELGFISSPTETELIINTQNSMGDFIHHHLNSGDRIGLLGIEFDSKRRNRLNGIITEVNQKNIKIKVLQSYGNCPKYIQPKSFKPNPYYGEFSRNTSVDLSQTDKNIIANTDTFFIASSFNDGKKSTNRGVDISHRGGETGFITINIEGQLCVDDYLGNGFFNTLGNLLENPIASLLFCDWPSGNTLQVEVSAEIVWLDDAQHLRANTPSNIPQRILRFTPLKVERFCNGLSYLQEK